MCLQQRPSLSVDRIYLHFFSYSNSARGCRSSDLTAHKLHRLLNHNCLHTILHHTSWLCICILWHPGRIYPSMTSSGLTVQFYNRGLLRAALQRWCWVSCCYPGWLPLTPRYLYVFVSRLTEGVPELLQLGWFMTSSCSCSPWPTQLGVRCGLPVSRNLSGNPTSVEGRTERGGRGKEERRPSGRKMEWQIVEKKKKEGKRGSRWEHKLASWRAEAKGLKCTELAKA